MIDFRVAATLIVESKASGMMETRRRDHQAESASRMTQQASILTAREKAQLVQKQRAERRFHIERFIDNPIYLVGLGLLQYIIALQYRLTEAQIFNALAVGMWIATICLGLYFALNKKYPLIYPAYIVAYVVGCEVMWRQNEFTVFYEGSKYFTILTFLITWTRIPEKKAPILVVIYLILLIPGLVFTFFQETSNFHALSAGHAAGPLAIFAAMLFFSSLKISREELIRLFLLYIVPTAVVAAVTSYQLYFGNIVWTGDSNNDLAGEFGANQVSTAIGLGWFFASTLVLLLINRSQSTRLFPLLLLLIPWFIAQNFLTFSRGGLFGSAIALAVLMIHLITIPRRRSMFVVGVAAAVFLLSVLFPILDQTTNNNLARRFTEEEELTNLSNREEIIADELHLFTEYPLTGVGLGRSEIVRKQEGLSTQTPHTEYTRVLAEMGVSGIVFNLLYVIFPIMSYRKQQTITGKALVAGLALWALLYMFHTATRTAAPALTFGLAQALLAWDTEKFEEKIASVAPPIRRNQIRPAETVDA